MQRLPLLFLTHASDLHLVSQLIVEEVIQAINGDELQPCLNLVVNERRVNLSCYQVIFFADRHYDCCANSRLAFLDGVAWNIGTGDIQLKRTERLSYKIARGQEMKLHVGDVLTLCSHAKLRVEEGWMKCEPKGIVQRKRPLIQISDDTELRRLTHDLRLVRDDSESVQWLGGLVSASQVQLLASLTLMAKAQKEEYGEQDLVMKEADLTVEELMKREFDKIVGQDQLKKQLENFYKQVQLDKIRAIAGKEKDKRLYHMIFSGPPGTGKTTMANVVSKMMLKMKLVENEKVVFVNNALELLASYTGQTPAKVDAKVMEAKGGICFIDEAYSIVREGSHKGYGQEAIDTLMKHMDNGSNGATCTFIFAGYEKPMEDFLKTNDGLSRRIPYRYKFESYTRDQLSEIFRVMCKAKGEILTGLDVLAVPKLIETIDSEMLATQNGGLINNWINFAKNERDAHLDLAKAKENPVLASTLSKSDLEAALVKILNMKGGDKKPAASSPSPPAPTLIVRQTPPALGPAPITTLVVKSPLTNDRSQLILRSNQSQSSSSQVVVLPLASASSSSTLATSSKFVPREPLMILPPESESNQKPTQQQKQSSITQTTSIQVTKPVQQQQQKQQTDLVVAKKSRKKKAKEAFIQTSAQLSSTLHNGQPQQMPNQSPSTTTANNRFSTPDLCQIMRDLIDICDLRLTSKAMGALPHMIDHLPRHHRTGMTSTELKNWVRCAKKEREYRQERQGGGQQQQLQLGEVQKKFLVNKADGLAQEDLAYGLLRLIGQTPDHSSSSQQLQLQPHTSDSTLAAIFRDMLDVTGEQIDASTSRSFPHMISLLSPSYRASFDSSQLKSLIQRAKELRKERLVDGDKTQLQVAAASSSSSSASSSSSPSRMLTEMDLIYSLIGLPWYQQQEVNPSPHPTVVASPSNAASSSSSSVAVMTRPARKIKSPKGEEKKDN